jgi:hypothetical protein
VDSSPEIKLDLVAAGVGSLAPGMRNRRVPPFFAKSLESSRLREIPCKIPMSKSLDAKFFRMNDFWAQRFGLCHRCGLDHHCADFICGARSDVTMGLWKSLGVARVSAPSRSGGPQDSGACRPVYVPQRKHTYSFPAINSLHGVPVRRLALKGDKSVLDGIYRGRRCAICTRFI